MNARQCGNAQMSWGRAEQRTSHAGAWAHLPNADAVNQLRGPVEARAITWPRSEVYCRAMAMWIASSGDTR
jgi:hypothetical protein